MIDRCHWQLGDVQMQLHGDADKPRAPSLAESVQALLI